MSYFPQFIGISALMGVLLFLLITPLALLGLAVVVLAAVATVVALIAALVAAPFLLVGAVRRRGSSSRPQPAKDRAYTARATVSRA